MAKKKFLIFMTSLSFLLSFGKVTLKACVISSFSSKNHANSDECPNGYVYCLLREQPLPLCNLFPKNCIIFLPFHRFAVLATPEGLSGLRLHNPRHTIITVLANVGVPDWNS
jgi:hypothetical protein